MFVRDAIVELVLRVETETEDYTAELEPEVDKTHVYIMHYTTYRRDIPLVHFSSSNSCFTQTQ